MTNKPSKCIHDLEHLIKSKIDKGQQMHKALNFTQFRIIHYLLEHQDEEVYQKDLEGETHLNKASITGSIDSLQEKGLVKRVSDDQDKRKKKIVIMNKVFVIKNSFEKKMECIDDCLVSGISEEDLKTFYKVINKMYENLKKGEL